MHMPSNLPDIIAMTAKSVARISAFETSLRESNHQIGLKTQHFFHGDNDHRTYRRVVFLPAGCEMVGVLIKIPTTVIVMGDCFVWIEDSWRHVGNEVLTASARRKQHFLANEDTAIHMLFPSQAKTVDAAEREFTDNFNDLLSRRIDAGEETIITGE